MAGLLVRDAPKVLMRPVVEFPSFCRNRNSSIRDGVDSWLRSVIVEASMSASDFVALPSIDGFGDSLFFVSGRILFTTSGLGMLKDI